MKLRNEFKMLWVAALGVCFALVAIHQNHEVPLIPQELLFGNPTYVSPSISPDGKNLAYSAPYNGVMNIWVGSLDNPEDARVVTNDTDRGIRSCWWGYDNETLFYKQDKDGNENWNIYRVVIETGETANLTPYPDVQVNLVHYSKKFPHHMLISMNKEDKKLRDVYVLDVTTGAATLVAKNPGTNVGWKADDDLVIRISWLMNDDGSATMLHRPNNESPWSELATFPPDIAGQSCSCVGFDNDGISIYCTDASDSDKARLIKLNTATRTKEILVSDGTYDVSPALCMHPESNHPVLAVIQRATHELIVLDNDYARDIEYLKEEAHGRTINIVSYDETFTQWVVQISSSDMPSNFYWYNRSTKQLTFLGSSQPALKKYVMTKAEPVTFTARDGLTIHGYLTYPATGARTNIPAVLFVHGGPWLRDEMDHCSPVVQLLANRGYACFQINYRGSAGYGRSFFKAGNKEWGNAMQHDLTDGVAWLVDQGIADPQHVAIVGTSYGGYAALAGAAFTPDLYCCAVDLCGISSLTTFMKSIPPYWKPLLARMKIQVGDMEADKKILEERSPLLHADKIRIPLLIGQGVHDPRVVQAESEQIVAALRERNIPCEYLLFANEGHGLARPENRLKFYRAVEQFLATHLGGRCEAEYNLLR